MRTYLPWLWVLSVSVLNVLLNITAKTAADGQADFFSAVMSLRFVCAALVGLASLFCLLAVYSSGLSIPQAILLAGAGSIIVGTIAAVCIYRVRLDWSEWALLLVIGALYFYRWVALTIRQFSLPS